MTENSTTFEIGLLVPGLIAPLDPKAGIGATMPPAGAGNVRCPAHFRRSANNRYPPFAALQDRPCEPAVSVRKRSSAGGSVATNRALNHVN